MGAQPSHSMYTRTILGGWRLMGMAQAFPIGTVGLADPSSPLDDSGLYLTQAAAMVNVESPGGTFVLRVTPNLEALTQDDGELTFGGWGEGFIDARHPHTLLHEAMLSLNLWTSAIGSVSISGGKGFAPFGTDDPMARPSVKYPTNHHLSQILERFTLNAVWAREGWRLEAGLFGGSEPDDPYDFSNIRSFGDSWSVRASRSLGAPVMGQSAVEISGSFADVAGGRSDEPNGHSGMSLINGSIRLDTPLRANDRVYALAEFSRSDPGGDDGYESLLLEAAYEAGRHKPYVRFEHATRPEFPRLGTEGDDYFRYDHEAEAAGSTRWSIVSVGYGFEVTGGFVSVRPFAEAQLFAVSGARGGLRPQDVLGDTRFGAISLGGRIFFGGEPMRMGAYGILDPMSRMGM